MCLHLVAFSTIFILPRLLRSEKRIEGKQGKTIEKTTTENSTNNELNTNDNQCDANIKDKLSIRYKSGVNDGETTEQEAQISHIIKEKFDIGTRNIEEFIDETVTGIVELKDDLMRVNDTENIYIQTDGLRKRNADNKLGNPTEFIKYEIDALNAAVQQAHVLPAVLSNGHAK